jgi:subtilisin family serine protease
MERRTWMHLALGTLAVLISGIAGEVARLSLEPEAQPVRFAPAPVWSGQTGAAAPRLLVKFRPGVRLAAQFAAPLAGTTEVRLDDLFPALPGIAAIGFESRDVALSALDSYRRSPMVEWAEADITWHADARPRDPRFDDQWGLLNSGQSIDGRPGGRPGVDIGAADAWQSTRGSRDVVVAVIDSGVDYRHEDLKANFWVNEAEVPGNGVDDDNNGVVDDVHGYNAVEDNGDPLDDAGHGTHVAGIIGAVGDNSRGIAGVNWTTRLMALKFLAATGGGSTTDAVECFDYALQMKQRGANIRVINCSWGGGEESRALAEAIERAHANGILVVCAAGNDGLDTDLRPHFPSSYDSDAVLAVAALAPDDTMAPFSNWGSTSVDVAAPGVTILSTLPDDQYGFYSGTSMAAPFVAGVAALALAREPSMPPGRLRDAVMGGAAPVRDLASRLATGGRVNGPGALAR